LINIKILHFSTNLCLQDAHLLYLKQKKESNQKCESQNVAKNVMKQTIVYN